MEGLKASLAHLRYFYLRDNSSFPMIMAASLGKIKKEKLLRVLKVYKSVIGWTIFDNKGISPFICMHKILMKENFKPIVYHQRYLNTHM